MSARGRLSQGGATVSYSSRKQLRQWLCAGVVVPSSVVGYVATRTRDNGLDFGAIAFIVGCFSAVALDGARDRSEPCERVPEMIDRW